MSNFFSFLSWSDLSTDSRLQAIGAYSSDGTICGFRLFNKQYDIDSLCWSLHAWSRTLLSFWLVEPVIQAAEKFLVARILSWNRLHISHHKLSMCLCCLSQHSQVSVLCSFSCCDYNFWKVATDTCLLACFSWLPEVLAEKADRKFEMLCLCHMTLYLNAWLVVLYSSAGATIVSCNKRLKHKVMRRQLGSVTTLGYQYTDTLAGMVNVVAPFKAYA